MGQLIDITGQKFGKLTVTGRAPNNSHGHTSWNCVCDCGRSVVAIGQALKSGNKISCGCSRIKNIAGQKFNMLTAIRVVGSRDCAIWRCLCDCGNYRDVRAPMLRSGQAFSCGCKTRDGRKLHGMSRHPLYGTYISMRKRCENPDDRAYPDYGGRGITVCDRWKNGDGELTGFECYFLDLGDRPEGMSLDRIDANKGYSPDNCRWATPKAQTANRRPSARNRVFRQLLSAVDAHLSLRNDSSFKDLEEARKVFDLAVNYTTPSENCANEEYRPIAANDNTPHRKTA